MRVFPPQVSWVPCVPICGRRFRCVRLVQALPSFSPSAGLVPCLSASAFLFSCPFRVSPLRARCVGVGVCSSPLLLRSPPVPVKYFFISPSLSSHPHSPLHPHLHLFCTKNTLRTAGCVCVWNVCTDVKFQRWSCILYHNFVNAGDHRGPGGVGDQRRHLPGTRVNVPAGHLGALK